jgi:hypothetical protein
MNTEFVTQITLLAIFVTLIAMFIAMLTQNANQSKKFDALNNRITSLEINMNTRLSGVETEVKILQFETKAFPQKHDLIFRYSKTNKFLFSKDEILIPYSEATLKRRTYAETQKKGIQFKGKNHNEYLKGRIPFDWWDDIPAGGQISRKELIGYPTQKPEALMERIIKCASNKGDTILDPFVGGGTTVTVAEKLGRKWIGIDQSVQAVKVSELRLDKMMIGLFSETGLPFNHFTTQLHKYDYDTLRHKDSFEFESWIIEQFGGTPNIKQRSDFGIDGKTKNNLPIQVKRSDNIGRDVVDKFHSALMRYDKKLYEKNKKENATVGYIIAFSFGRGAVQEVARLKLKENIIIKLITVEEIVPISKKPNLDFNMYDKSTDSTGFYEIEFRASAASSAGIQFYSWDFNYSIEDGFRADVMIDKEGVQVWKFEAGLYNIAVKVIDNDGLESIEYRKLKINGGVLMQ